MGNICMKLVKIHLCSPRLCCSGQGVRGYDKGARNPRFPLQHCQVIFLSGRMRAEWTGFVASLVESRFISLTEEEVLSRMADSSVLVCHLTFPSVIRFPKELLVESPHYCGVAVMEGPNRC